MVVGKRRLKYRGVEVIATASACDAARALKNVRLLSAEVPRLPLDTCDRPAHCNCTYLHFEDRRQGPRRDDGHATLPVLRLGPDRRVWRGRRDSDYA